MKSIIASAALVAATAASNLAARGEGVYNFNATAKLDQPLVKVVNRCPYSVYLWSIGKQPGCPPSLGLELKTGQFYHENYQTSDTVGEGGVSIKLSKTATCPLGKLTQLEYKIETKDKAFEGNYLDMSFVDCTSNLEDCPGRTDGFYLQSGNQNGEFMTSVNNEHCPIFSVNNAEEAAKVSYINWDDRQTKFCNQNASLALYLCGGEAPGAEEYSPAPSSSAAPSSEIESSSAQPSSSSSSSEEAAPSTTEEADFVVAAAAAVTPAPVAPVIKTEIVYVTEYVKRRHAHGRRHQQFHV